MFLSAFLLNVNGQHPKGETYRGQQYYNGAQQQTYYPNDPSRQKVQYPQTYQNQQQTYQQQQYYPSQQQNVYQSPQQSYQQQSNPTQQNYKPYNSNQQPAIKPSQSNVNYQSVKPIYSQQNPKPSGLPLSTRFGASDDPNAYINNQEITTRIPPSKVGIKVTRPAQVPPRFDDINNRKLTWDAELTHNAEKFALFLFYYLAESEKGNFMISPQSVHNLLDLIAEGSSGNTYNELNTTLGLINKQRTRDFHQYSNLALK